jgi:chromosome segregation ATPase
LELERREKALSERDLMESRAEPEFKAQIADLQNQIQEKDRVLEGRAREIDILQARVESLSGQAARLEAAQRQALADAAEETDRARQMLQAQITALESRNHGQHALLEEKQAALAEIEQKLFTEIEESKERSARQQTSLQEQTTELRQAGEEARALRERLAQLESAGAEAAETAARRAGSDAMRIAALEQQLASAQQTLAQREAALQRSQEQLQNPANGKAGNLSDSENQNVELKVAQDKIAELLERLAQLEAARHTAQENAGHELQQLRESFESRIAKLRMELIAKEKSQAQNQPSVDNHTTISGVEEGFHRQIRELQIQLVEQHTLLENRNEELIKVKAELDALQDPFTQLGIGPRQESIDKPASVELREEDAVDPPPGFANGSVRADLSQRSEAGPGAHMGLEGVGHSPGGAVASNRFTHLEGRVRSWNPQPQKDSTFGSGRRWNIGLFKRRWKN